MGEIVAPNMMIRDMKKQDEYYVGTCTHINESKETDKCSDIRIEWFKKMYDRGLRIKVALLDGKYVGFIYMMPIEISPWGPLGDDLMYIPCLVSDEEGQGVGKALIDSAEKFTKEQGKKGILTTAYFSDFFFMPGEFFEKYGFEVVKSKRFKNEELTEVLMWKIFDNSVEEPEFIEPKYDYKPVEGEVVVDLFWNIFCLTSVIEANRVKKIAEQYEEKVVLNEHKIGNRYDLLEHGISRGIYVNGEEIFWGYEAPEDGIREAIEKYL